MKNSQPQLRFVLGLQPPCRQSDSFDTSVTQVATGCDCGCWNFLKLIIVQDEELGGRRKEAKKEEEEEEGQVDVYMEGEAPHPAM